MKRNFAEKLSDKKPATKKVTLKKRFQKINSMDEVTLEDIYEVDFLFI